MMWCAQCGTQLERHILGSWKGCCDNYGYWTKQGPLPMDQWYPHDKVGQYYFYPGPKWPKDLPPVLPREA